MGLGQLHSSHAGESAIWETISLATARRRLRIARGGWGLGFGERWGRARGWRTRTWACARGTNQVRPRGSDPGWYIARLQRA
jgi:hypothetical protein